MHNSNATTNTNISKNRAACLEVCQVYLKLHIELPNFFDFLQYVANVTHELTQDLADTGDQKFGCMGERDLGNVETPVREGCRARCCCWYQF